MKLKYREHSRTTMRYSFPVYLLTFTLFCVCVQFWTGVYQTDRSLTGDEAAHFVNSLLVFDFLRDLPFTNPLQYAEQYYLHFPRVTIGHWPPLFYAAQAIVFAVVGRSGVAALEFQAMIAGLACAWPASLVQRRLGHAAGFATGLFVLASPNLLFLLDAVMVDTLMGVVTLAAALCWARFAEKRQLKWAVVFAIVSSAAILLKGNGFALAMLPLLYAVIMRDVQQILDWRAWFAASLVIVAVGPWYAFTWAMAADGFNYRFGWNYTSHALPVYLTGLLQTLGIIGLLGFVMTLWRLGHKDKAMLDPTVAAMVAAALALFLFHLVTPADTTPRYLVALVPSSALPVVMGLEALIGFLSLSRITARVVTALLVVVGATSIYVRPHLSSYGMMSLVETVMQSQSANHVVLIAGSPRAEGALIATFAEKDLSKSYYVLRATQMMASGGFMGQGYATRFSDDAAFREWLDHSGIGWLVLDLSSEAALLAHNSQVEISAYFTTWKFMQQKITSNGVVRLYQLTTESPDKVQMKALLSRVVPNTLSQK